jgi:hypothetical protein
MLLSLSAILLVQLVALDILVSLDLRLITSGRTGSQSSIPEEPRVLSSALPLQYKLHSALHRVLTHYKCSDNVTGAFSQSPLIFKVRDCAIAVMGEASAEAQIRYCQSLFIHSLFSDHNLARRCCRWRVPPQARKILENKLLWPKERSATAHVVLLSTYYALRGIRVFLPRRRERRLKTGSAKDAKNGKRPHTISQCSSAARRQASHDPVGDPFAPSGRHHEARSEREPSASCG